MSVDLIDFLYSPFVQMHQLAEKDPILDSTELVFFKRFFMAKTSDAFQNEGMYLIIN